MLGVKDLKEERVGPDIREKSYSEGLHKFCYLRFKDKFTAINSRSVEGICNIHGRDFKLLKMYSVNLTGKRLVGNLSMDARIKK